MSNLQLDNTTLPRLFHIADQASIKAQLRYYGWLRFYLIWLILAAIPALFVSDENSRIGAIVSLTSFSVSLIVLVLRSKSNQMEKWYSSRAVAESVKTRAWRWVMKADPYTKGEPQENPSQQFVLDLQDIVDQNKAFSQVSAREITIQNSISKTMSAIRARSNDERFDFYKDHRVNDQAKWYASKSEINKKQAKIWLLISVALHAVAIFLLLLRIFTPTERFPVEVIATIASAALSWMEAKRYSELTSSYRLAADEIKHIQSNSLPIRDDSSLSKFVVDSENAFSREHTQWVARSSA